MKASFLFRSFSKKQIINLNRQCSGQIKKYDEKDKIKLRSDRYDGLKKLDDEIDFPVSHKVPYIVDRRPWVESKAIKRHVKQRSRLWKMDMTITEIKAALQSHKDLPITPQEFKYWMARRKMFRDVYEQEFIPERQLLLRPDLAAAHFIYNRGGAVKFYGDKRWVGLGRDIEALPQYYVPGLYVEYIDAVGCRLQYEGLINLTKLLKLKWMNLSGNDYIDNWCMDLISGEYGKQLEHLDISDCYRVNEKGLTCCYRFEKLKYLNVTNIAGDDDFKMTCALLEDHIPGLDIIGVDYSIPEKEKFSIDVNQKLFD